MLRVAVPRSRASAECSESSPCMSSWKIREGGSGALVVRELTARFELLEDLLEHGAHVRELSLPARAAEVQRWHGHAHRS